MFSDYTKWAQLTARPAAAPSFLWAPQGSMMLQAEHKGCMGRVVSPTVAWREDCLRAAVDIETPAGGYAYALINFYDGDGEILQREYLLKSPGSEPGPSISGSGLYRRQLRPPRQTAAVSMEIGGGWAAGRFIFYPPTLEAVSDIPARKVRLGGAFCRFPGTLEGNTRVMCEAAQQAGQAGVNMLCFTEHAFQLGIQPGTAVDHALSLDAPALASLAAVGKQNRMMIIVGCYIRQNNEIYNCALLYGRAGELIGIHRKIQLPLNEVEGGVLPGDRLDSFQTEFGRVGLMICWEQAFPYIADRLVQRGAEILFCPTLGYSTLQPAARAADGGVPLVVVARRTEPLPVRVFSSQGDILAAASGGPEAGSGLAFCDIDLAAPPTEIWCSVGPCASTRTAVYAAERLHLQ